MLSDPSERYPTLGMLSGALLLFVNPECFGAVYSLYIIHILLQNLENLYCCVCVCFLQNAIGFLRLGESLKSLQGGSLKGGRGKLANVCVPEPPSSSTPFPPPTSPPTLWQRWPLCLVLALATSVGHDPCEQDFRTTSVDLAQGPHKVKVVLGEQMPWSGRGT